MEFNPIGKLFIISDTHFYHKNIIKYCDRPFKDVDEMNKAIIDNWNSVVSHNDTVLCLGDFLLGGASRFDEIVPHLNGRLYLIKGNHDDKSNKFYLEHGFTGVTDSPLEYENIIFSHHPKTPKDGKINLFGHIHNEEKFDTFLKDGVCCCLERWGYKPVELSTILDLWDDYGKKASETIHDCLKKITIPDA